MLTMDSFRWCPPNNEFDIEKGLWAAVAAVGMSQFVFVLLDRAP